MYSLTIIGGGAISTGYDSPTDDNILTHIHGALVHSSIKLDAIVEINKEQQIHIRDKWGEEFDIFSSTQDAFDRYRSDIVVVATPTSSHLHVIKDIYSIYEPKLILCEKPIVMSIDELNELENIQKQKSTKILTNYIRRFDPSLNKIKDFIQDNKSIIHHFYGTFTKGFLHNGSHMIDLIYMLVGEIDNLEVINKNIISQDIFGQFIVKTDKCGGVISNINNNQLSLFEFIIYTDTAKIEIRGSKQDNYIYHVKKSDIFKGYQSFSERERLPKTLDKYGYNTLEFAIRMIENDNLYSEVNAEQSRVNRFILLTQQKLIGA